MLKIIEGRIASGKTQYIINEIGKRIERKQKSVLIVPDRLTYNYELRICKQLKTEGFIDVEVCSFNRFAANVLEYCGKRNEVFLDNSAKAMAMRRSIVKCRDDLSVFKTAYGRKGFAGRCLNMISTIENCNYTPDDIVKVSGELEKSVLKDKLDDTLKIYTEYNRVLATGYTDNPNRLVKARECVKAYSPLRSRSIFIDGFDIFTTRLLSFIGELIKYTDVTVAVSSACNGNDKKTYAIHETTLNRLIATAESSNTKYTEETVENTDNSCAREIAFIRDNLFAYPHSTYDGSAENIFLKSYKTVFDEITAVAEVIADGVRNKNKRYKDYAVLSNDVNSYSPIIQSIFARFEIPVFTNTKHSIVNHPIASYLFSVLNTVKFGLRTELIAEYVLTGFSSLTDDEADEFLTGLTEYGIKDYELSREIKRPVTTEKDENALNRFEELRQKLIPELAKAKTKFTSLKNAREYTKACYEILSENAIADKVNALVNEYEEMGKNETNASAENRWFTLSDVTSQVWNKTIKLLEDIAVLFENDEISIDEFIFTLHEAYDASPISTIPVTIDCVTFGGLNAAKEQQIDTVFVVGAVDGKLPGVFQNDRLLTMRESEVLSSHSFELATTPTMDEDRARYSVYAAFCAPKCALYVSYPKKSFEHQTNYASSLFDTFKILFGKDTEDDDSDRLRQAVVNPVSVKQTFLGLALDHLESPESNRVATALEDNGIALPHLSEKPEKIDKKLADELFTPDKTISVSRIEDYASCPFKHYVDYALKPQITKEYLPDVSEIGTMYHKTLESFVSYLFDNGQKKTLDEMQCRSYVSKNLAAQLENIHFGAYLATERQKLLSKQLTDIISDSVMSVYGQFNDFTLKATELSFGNGNNSIKYTLKTDLDELTIVGKIDRVDEKTENDITYVRVIDYKSSNPSAPAEKLIEIGKRLQAYIYLAALTDDVENTENFGAFYVPVDPDGIKNSAFNQKDPTIDKKVRTSVAKATELAGSIQKGNISVAPQNNDACEYCEYKAICRRPKISAVEEE